MSISIPQSGIHGICTEPVKPKRLESVATMTQTRFHDLSTCEQKKWEPLETYLINGTVVLSNQVPSTTKTRGGFIFRADSVISNNHFGKVSA